MSRARQLSATVESSATIHDRRELGNYPRQSRAQLARTVRANLLLPKKIKDDDDNDDDDDDDDDELRVESGQDVRSKHRDIPSRHLDQRSAKVTSTTKQ